MNNINKEHEMYQESESGVKIILYGEEHGNLND